MSFADDLQREVQRIFRQNWTSEETEVVPDTDDLRLESNHAKKIAYGAVLYADLHGSTQMVQQQKRHFSAEVYKAFLYSAAQLVREEGGDVTAYDGDRIMAVFLGDTPSTDAARCGLKINYAVKNYINPAIVNQYGAIYAVRHTVGIDGSDLFVARTGVRGDNDLVWVGRAANYAAKLTELTGAQTYITYEIFDRMHKSTKFSSKTGEIMWDKREWTAMNKMTIYRSSWTWVI